MGYFPNGTAGMCFEEQYCAQCVHNPIDEDEPGCAVMLAHNIYNYDFCNEKEHPAKVILDWLIPMSADGVGVEKCAMFHDRDPEEAAFQRRHRDDRRRYEAAMAETCRARLDATTEALRG